MHSTTLFLSAFAATVATAFQAPPEPAHVAAAIKARGTPECTKVASSILPKLTPIPTIPADLESYVLYSSDMITQTDPCVDPIITGSIGSVYSSYASSASSWSSEHLEDLRSLWGACSDVPEISSAFAAIESEAGTAVCSSKIAAWTSQPTNAAPRETGMPIAAAAAFAGFVVAAL